VKAGATSGETPLEHPGEELIYVLSGQLEFVVAGKSYRLRAGDALHLRTVQQHAWRNPGRQDASALWMALRPQ
jgi:quercetin dioxygenase-like cupin family protein